jgi:FO synthase
VARTVDADPDGAAAHVGRARRCSSTSTTWRRVLEAEGVAAFEKSFDELLGVLETRVATWSRDESGSPTRPRCSSRSRCCAGPCGYCTFAQPPARLERRTSRPTGPGHRPLRGACGVPRGAVHPRRAPEERYEPRRSGSRPRVRLDGRLPGGDVRLVLDETGLLPHANAGALFDRRAGRAPAGQPVAGDDARVPRRRTSSATGAPPTRRPNAGWRPSRRPGALRSRSPPGSSSGSASPRRPHRRARGDRRVHRRHGHVQEVIVQNFLPKAGTAMHRARRARRRVPRGDRPGPADPAAEVHLQAPPNLSDDFGPARRRDRRLGWRLPGHRRPRQPRAALARARPPARGDRGAWVRARTPADDLSPFGPAARRWLDPAMRFPVMDRSDAEGLGATTPARCSPSACRRTRRRAPAPRSSWSATARPSGTRAPDVPPPLLVRRRGGSGLHALARAGWARCSTASSGQEVGEDEIVTLFSRARPEVVASPRSPTSSGAGRSATSSPSCATATSTTRTCAPSSAGSAASPRVR